MSKPFEYIKRGEIGSLIQIKGRRKGMSGSYLKMWRILYTFEGIPKYLPRKLKKKLYGTKDNRKHLALRIKEDKKLLNSIVKQFNVSDTPLNFLTKSTNHIDNEQYNWKTNE